MLGINQVLEPWTPGQVEASAHKCSSAGVQSDTPNSRAQEFPKVLFTKKTEAGTHVMAFQCHGDGTQQIREQDTSHQAPLETPIPSLGIGGSSEAPNNLDPIELSLSV